MNNLAVIIPAYKDTYFDEALDSLAKQTNNNFNVYIGDDCSPHNLKDIVEKYASKLNIKYVRFDNNIGSENLVLQWKRCVELSYQEEWLWLFSDDDLIDKEAVEKFYYIVNHTQNKFDVYRFNTCTIGSKGELLSVSPTGPSEESSEAMAYNLLYGRRGNSIADHIFSREVYNKTGGFVFTQYAQGADWATSMRFSQEKGIFIIPDSKFYWRYSGLNISSVASKNTNKMLNGHLQFIEWVLAHFRYLKGDKFSISYNMIENAADYNLRIVIAGHYKKMNIRNTVKVFNFYRIHFNLSIWKSLRKILLIKENTFPLYRKLILLINKFRAAKI